MTGDQSPQQDGPAPGAGQGWTVVGYLIAGMLVWGLVGWLVDRWWGTGGIATAVGIAVGTAGGIYLVLKRVGPK